MRPRIVSVLVQAFAQRKLPHQFFNNPDLIFCDRQIHFAGINALDALTGGDISYRISQVSSGFRCAALDVRTLENVARNFSPPSCPLSLCTKKS